MTKKQQQKMVQYLNEAHASEQALTRVLQSQIAMTPSGSYRKGLETHLKEIAPMPTASKTVDASWASRATRGSSGWVWSSRSLDRRWR